MNIRTTKPGTGNKFFITKSKGGYSQCIQGKPTDSSCNVLSNCVGYACGRFNEIIGSMKYPSLNCNAENFIERAKSLGLKISTVPTLGGIMVWQKGSTLGSSDGAGHVEVVERIDSENQIYTSSSNYGGTAFYNALRKNDNGRWGLSSSYRFRGCIINPTIGDVHYVEKPKPVPTPVINDLKVNDKVKINIKSNGYSASADGKAQGGRRYKTANGWIRYIIKIYEGKAYPYQVGLGNQTTGFFKKEDLEKI